MNALSGKKTYIVAFVYAGVQLARAFGVEIPHVVDELLIALGATTLRASIAKVQS